MPQTQKPEVRARILAAALEAFASEGYLGATMAGIASRADLGAASLYRYYPTKESLFEAAIPGEVVDGFRDLLTRRVKSLAAARRGSVDPTGEEMLRFWVRHRLEVVVLLDRAEGTRHGAFGEWFVGELVNLTTDQLRIASPGLRLGAPDRFVLRRIFENTRSMLAAILEKHADEASLREAVSSFWSYQTAGLRGFAARVAK